MSNKSLIQVYLEEQKILSCLEELGAIPNAENLNKFQSFILAATTAAREEEAWNLTTAMECGHVLANLETTDTGQHCIVCSEIKENEKRFELSEPTLATQCAELVSEWGREAKLNPDNEHQIGIVETLKDCAGDLAALPDVAAVLKGEA